MKKPVLTIFMLITVIFLAGMDTNAQAFLKKLQERAEDEAIDAIFGKDKQGESSSSQSTSSSSSSSSSGSVSNTRGGGLSSTRADVVALIGTAESSFDSKKYKDARNAIRQAILGVELEIGEKILNDLPGSIAGLSAITDEDNVTSSGIGFVGLIIERTYREGDQEFKVGIGNDSGWLSAANMYMASGAYASSSADQGHKQITFQGHQGVIEYDEYSGYKLSVPFGQSSVMVTEGVNFGTEEEFMSANEKLDIEKFKKQLGEQ